MRSEESGGSEKGGFRLKRNDGIVLRAQATNQSKFQIFPEAPERFFYKVVDAQIVFTVDSGGKVTGLAVHQGGQVTSGPKIR